MARESGCVWRAASGVDAWPGLSCGLSAAVAVRPPFPSPEGARKGDERPRRAGWNGTRCSVMRDSARLLRRRSVTSDEQRGLVGRQWDGGWAHPLNARAQSCTQVCNCLLLEGCHGCVSCLRCQAHGGPRSTDSHHKWHRWQALGLHAHRPSLVWVLPDCARTTAPGSTMPPMEVSGGRSGALCPPGPRCSGRRCWLAPASLSRRPRSPPDRTPTRASPVLEIDGGFLGRPNAFTRERPNVRPLN